MHRAPLGDEPEMNRQQARGVTRTRDAINGCATNIQGVLQILCYFEDFLNIFRTLWFPLGVSVCTQLQVENQRCSRTGRVRKNNIIIRKKNTIFNEHPVVRCWQFFNTYAQLDVFLLGLIIKV